MSLSSNIPSPLAAEHEGPRLRTPTTNAIPLSSVQYAKLYSGLHTVAVIVHFLLRFRDLVADPYRTMILDLGPLVVLQCAYCVAFLPSTGKWPNTVGGGGSSATVGSQFGKLGKASGTGSLRKRPAGSSRTGAFGSGGWKEKIMPIIIALTLTVVLVPVPLMVLAHILGAPLFPANLIVNTAVLSLHVALLTCLPLFYTHGVSGPAWRDILAAWLPFDEAGVWGGSIGCLVGGWLGSIPMALDWDRDWQAWPVPVLVGCYGGWAAGKTMFGPVFLRGKRIDMSVGAEQKALQSSQDTSNGESILSHPIHQKTL